MSEIISDTYFNLREVARDSSHLLRLPPEVPAAHHVLRGGLAPEAARDEDLLRRPRQPPTSSAAPAAVHRRSSLLLCRF